MVFFARHWSPDGRQILGTSAENLGGREGRITIYDLASDSYSFVTEVGRDWHIPTWGPQSESVFILNAEGLQLVDINDRSQHLVVSNDDFPGISEVNFDADKNVLIFLIQQVESDLWMVQLAAE